MRAILLPASLALALAAGPVLAADPGFVDRQGPDQWRASRLVGVDVLGPDGKTVGKVTDLLMDHDGRATTVVVGIGGFLGLGRKEVALPFAAVRFTDARRTGGAAGSGNGAPDSAAGMPTEPGMAAGSAVPVETPAAQGEAGAGGTPAPAAKGGPVGTTSGVPGGTVTGQAAAPAPGAEGGPVVVRTPPRPDHATIDLTFDQLKAAPGFSFAP